ncbi:hypothetical protein GGTG_12527 [Gaeumannomyces tritici R3-111a-1]|uniref:Myb/SANT-like domain-containing protein n=1 Tax=Gaeumannomyces tritici (strain R3-111a-1) TaxID=644352 RepID=J3PGA3_GAET3|nr:hypothetical protein GGTG_12527 [Gaeumannomyces tritici R3-111a-1]EJT69643.1 hypothetical protein GGTG_12527 [Gaeumannomyces tritici R3-111a-1]
MASPRITLLYAEGNASGNNEPDLTAADDAVDREPSPGPAPNGRETPSQALSQQEPAPEPAPTAAAAAAGTKWKRPATDPNKKTVRFSWNAQQTAAVMEWLLVARQEGLLAVQKRANLAVAWRRVLELAKAAWGEAAVVNLAESKIADKYNNEKKCYLAWARWVSKSGRSYDTETGAVQGVDTTSAEWKKFAARVKGMAVAWIALGQPLGKVSTYQALWVTDRAKGDHIQEFAGDAVVPPAAGLDPFADGMPPPLRPPPPPLAESIVNADVDDDEENDGEAEEGGEGGGDEGETAEARRRRETDPDLNPVLLAGDGEDWERVNVQRGRPRPPSRRYPSSPSPSPFSANSSSVTGVTAPGLSAGIAAGVAVANSLASIAAAMVAGNKDGALTAAAADLRQRYQETRPPREILRACKRLRDDGNVALWNAMV